MEGDKKKILIVDDDNFLLDMYALKFSQNNFAVHTASNGLQAIEKLKGGLDPEIILSDIMMPEMDGFEMLEKINIENLAPSSLKLVLSNRNQQADIDRGGKLGVAGYIIKASSTPMEVITQVKDVLLANMMKK
ncbi:MAG: response regulator [Candidatus Pacebacteria bacterium]|nr:response regulator [Candidatus Paceibacterota bacterium]